MCTGNVCRPPTAARLLRAGLEERAGAAADVVVLSSAGTRALVGEPRAPGRWRARGAVPSRAASEDDVVPRQG